MNKNQIIDIARQIQLRAKDKKYSLQTTHLATHQTNVEMLSHNNFAKLHTHANNIGHENTTEMMNYLQRMYNSIV